MNALPTAVVFGAGVLTGYWIAYCAVRHYERQPIKVKSLEFGQLKLNEEETEQVLKILKGAVHRKVVK